MTLIYWLVIQQTVARPSNTEERRREIVDAMLRVMARQGYAKASVAAVAREAGITPGLIHYHFRDKQEILLALIDRLAEAVRARFEATRARTPLGRVHAWIDAHLARGEGADPDAVACWVALGNEALAEAAVRAAYVRVIESDRALLEGLVRDALAHDGARTADARRIAAGLLAAVEGAFRLAILAPEAIPEGSAASTVRQMADGLLAAARGKR